MELKYRELIIAGLAAYIIWGYAVYWLPVLRYGAYAFVAGGAVTLMGIGALVLLTPGWPQQDGAMAYRRPNRAAFGAEGAWEQEKASQARSGYSPVRLFPASFVVSDNLDAVLDLVLRDFITSWYSNISPSPAFAIEVDRTIRTALVSIRDRLLQLDFVDVAISRVIPIITNHLREFDQAERVIRGKKLNRNVTESEELDLAIAGKYREGRLHPAASLSFADTRLLQQEHSRKVASRLLQEVVPGDLLKSRAVSVLLQEIVACAILSPVMQLLSDPDTWNQLLEGYVIIPTWDLRLKLIWHRVEP